MNREYYESPASNILRLHVSGFPPHVSNSSILKYFSKFGRVYIEQEGHLPQQYGSSRQELSQVSIEQIRKRKNYLVLSCMDIETRESILQYIGHRYQGCSIFCNEYKTGYDLIIHNQLINQRRCILRKVPISFSRQEVVSRVEKEAGAIESLFVYEPMKSYRTVRHYSVSITFCNSESLFYLLEAAEHGIYFNGQRINVDKYGIKGKFFAEQPLHLKSTKPSLVFSDAGNPTMAMAHIPIGSKAFNVTSIGAIAHPLSIHQHKPISREYHSSRKNRDQEHTVTNIRINLKQSS